jgi:hypothetical protein
MRILCYGLIALIMLPQVTPAQTAPVVNREWSIFTTLQPNEKLVARLKDGKTVEGRLTRVSDKAIILSTGGNTIDLDRENVARAYRVTGASVKKPVLIGLTAGAAVGAGLGIAAGSCKQGELLCLDKSDTVPIATAVFAGVGVLVGFITGKMRHKRVLIYEAI